MSQCFAPTSCNGRCKNKSIEKSRHCELHHPRATKLYAKYKRLSKLCKDIDLEKEFTDILSKINHVMNCYKLYDRTYNARLKHREYAIAPNLYDQGHDFQFIELTNKIDLCETKLRFLYLEHESKTKETIEYKNSDSSDEDKNKIVVYQKNPITIAQKIKLNKERRAIKERETNQCIEKYIKENEDTIERKRQLAYNLFKCVSLLFDSEDLIDRPLIISMISLVIKLNSINYFSSNFTPKRCQHPACKCTIPYSLCLGGEHINMYRCFCQYMEFFSEEELKRIFENFLLNKNKIMHFAEDIFSLYYEYEDDVIFIDVNLVWNGKELDLIEDDSEREPVKTIKHSKQFAIARLKDKYYEREMTKNMFDL